MAYRMVFLLLVLSIISCNKDEDCVECGFYSGLSTKVDFLPGTTTGSYSTTTKTYEVARAGEGFRTDFFFYTPNESGDFMEVVDHGQVGEKGYEALTVRLANDTLYFFLDKTEGRSEEFLGVRIK
ncbi:MAG: hypothetical protein H6568_13515 [Lewinellaceae bacterium]|nr:hypothetical protein [Saprospiraceae bacterium]MCB9313773.1 hypothetical protein [Lewinellaceae bacterium]HRW74326.1 hypothetical protein [Saprospiraceae bacterium]